MPESRLAGAWCGTKIDRARERERAGSAAPYNATRPGSTSCKAELGGEGLVDARTRRLEAVVDGREAHATNPGLVCIA